MLAGRIEGDWAAVVVAAAVIVMAGHPFGAYTHVLEVFEEIGLVENGVDGGW